MTRSAFFQLCLMAWFFVAVGLCALAAWGSGVM